MTKQLTQAVFSLPDCPKWAKSAAVDEDGEAWFFNYPKAELIIEGIYKGFWDIRDIKAKFCLIGRGYDTTNWQQSAIDKEAK